VRPGDVALAATYFAYYGAIGIFQPYWPAYLASLGLAPSAIGAMLALFNAVRVAGPYVSAHAADAVADRRRVLWTLGLSAVVASLLLTQVRAPAWLALAFAMFSFACNGIMPIVDTLSIERLAGGAHRYSWLRLWGSVGYVACAAATGVLIGVRGVALVPWVILAMIATTTLLMLCLPRVARPAPRPKAAGAAGGDRRALLRLLLIAFLQLTGFGAYYGFYTLYLAHYGYAPATIGAYWAFAVMAEVGMFIAAPALLARVGARRLLQVALAATVLRWSLCAAFPASRGVMLAAQSLHLAGFALFHAVVVQVAPRLVPAGRAARVQALVSGVSWGAGGIAGSLLAGWLWTAAGPRAIFAAAAGLALVAFALSVSFTAADTGDGHAAR
jgi:PPP family 3-phenylpropionic acid transporter